MCIRDRNEAYGLLGRGGNEHHRQHAEDERLHEASEPVEIQRDDGGDADGKERNGSKPLPDNAGDDGEQRVVRDNERRIDKGRNDRAGDDVAEVTEGHRDRREDLAQNLSLIHI